MLKIINDLEPFFQDNYKRINVREYARLRKTTPPTASKLLAEIRKEGLIEREDEKNYIYYVANKENPIFIHLSRLYWFMQFKEIGLIDYLEKELISPLIVLFGSFSKGEVKQESDIDLAVFSVSKKELNLEVFEKKIKHKIHLFTFKDKKDVANKDMLNNIHNGFVLTGGW